MNTIKLLDCTLRDGGYYNNWNFQDTQVANYLKQINQSNIDVVEIGFHFFEKNYKFGEFAYISEKKIQKYINNKIKFKIAIMFNGSDFIEKKFNFKKKIQSVFNNNTRKISIVRIAVKYKDLLKMKKYLSEFKKKGVKTCLNLMQINTIKKEDLINCIKLIKSWNNVDIFYFADSFGNLNPKHVKNLCITIKKYWKKEFGFHSHNNCGLAFKNATEAYKHGATWIDGTIRGMGRGAGNVSTESLLKYFNKYNYLSSKIRNISEGYFDDLKKKYKWGPSKYYKYAAKFDIHPSFIQELTKDKRYNKKEINKLILNLSKVNAKSYDPKFLNKPSIIKNKNKLIWNSSSWCQSRDILILGQGPSLKDKKNIKIVEKFILLKKPLILSININKLIPEKLIDYYVTCNEPRIIVDHQNYSKLDKPIILPEKILKSLGFKKTYKVLNYDFEIKYNEFRCYKNYTIIPNNISFGYAISISIIGGANKIFLAGFDGFEGGYKLNYEMNKIFHLSKKNYPKAKIMTLTKSKYDVKNHFVSEKK